MTADKQVDTSAIAEQREFSHRAFYFAATFRDLGRHGLAAALENIGAQAWLDATAMSEGKILPAPERDLPLSIFSKR